MQTQTGARGETEGLEALAHEARMLVEELDTLPAARRLFEGRIDADGYARYLVQTYHYVRWTTPLLAEAGQRMKRLGLSRPLAELLLQKASEERGHERWLLKDLERLGWSPERVCGTPPCAAVTAYFAWNRYTARVGAPAAFLGTAYVLEYLSEQRASGTAERLVATQAIPHIHEAIRFLRGHGSVDGGHVAELMSALRSLTAREDMPALLLSARTTRVLYLGLFSEGEALQTAHTS